MINIRFFSFVILFCISLNTLAADDPKIIVDLPLADYSANMKDSYAPSMRQSLQLSTDYYQIGHYFLGEIFKNDESWSRLFVIGFDVVSFYTPFGDAWVHEEWHRATMSHRGIGSYNDVYNLKFGAGTIAVSHVTDENLTRFKRDHPAEFVRMSAAGMEAQLEQNLEFEKRKFFKETKTLDGVVMWVNTINVISYIHTCNSTDGDKTTNVLNREDGEDVSKRDFTGLDCIAWVYDLHRPDEPYSARGVHPSGVGVDRYIKSSDLTDEEKKYYDKQKVFTLLNVINPFLIGRSGFQSTEYFNKPVTLNFNLRHYLASFGHTIDLNLFYKDEEQSYLGIIHTYHSHEGILPGLEIQKIPRKSSDWQLSPRLAMWAQPEDQRFFNTRSQVGGLATVRIDKELSDRWNSYLEAGAKSEGWVAGLVELEPSAIVVLGVSSFL